jgi:hypothetical protein
VKFRAEKPPVAGADGAREEGVRDPGAPLAQTGASVEEPSAAAGDPGAPVADLGAAAADLGTPAADLGAPAADLGAAAADLGAAAADLGAPLADAAAPLEEPSPTVGEPVAAAPPGNMLPERASRRLGAERLLMRIIATAGIVGIGVVIAAILADNKVQGWIIGLVVAIVSVALSALLWSSRQL